MCCAFRNVRDVAVSPPDIPLSQVCHSAMNNSLRDQHGRSDTEHLTRGRPSEAERRPTRDD